jgi:hypothetical protein
VVQVFTDFYDRTDGYLPEVIMTDGYGVYEPVIVATYGVWRAELGLTAEQDARYDRHGMPRFYFPVEINYAKVVKVREGGRVVAVEGEVVLGREEQLAEALAESEHSETINTSFVERWFGTQRQFNARKKRKAYTFSKELLSAAQESIQVRAASQRPRRRRGTSEACRERGPEPGGILHAVLRGRGKSGWPSPPP